MFKLLPVLMTLFLTPPAFAKEANHEQHDHAGHVHTAPHGGTLIPFAEGSGNLELLLDSETGHLQLWILDGCAENFLRSPQKEIQLVLKRLKTSPKTAGMDRSVLRLPLTAVPNLLTGESVGNTSQFGVISDALIGVEKLAGFLASLKVRGTTLTKVSVTWP